MIEPRQQLRMISLELNEINFEMIQLYASEGRLPNFKRLIDSYGYTLTESEAKYEDLEPWIQWVTVHTGKTLAEHGVFRLGDIENTQLEQIWERLERDGGLKVAAMSPMNADNRTKDAAFFVPDPWTQSKVTGSSFLAAFYQAIAQTVNDNAQGRVTLKSLAMLALGALRYAAPSNYARYLNLVFRARDKKWNRAIFLDLLLADCFLGLSKKHRPNYATLFLNAGAHIQHHYLYSSPHAGNRRAVPEWYVSPDVDPVFEIYSIYDHILGMVAATLPDYRIQIVTGLHQDPHPEENYYWRLKNHDSFLRELGLTHSNVMARMSRDFLIVFPDRAAAERGKMILASVKSTDGEALFSIDDRGDTLFCEMTFSKDIPEDFVYLVGNNQRDGLRADVTFVAIKNAGHNGEGYLLDTGTCAVVGPNGERPRVQLSSLFDRTLAELGLAGPAPLQKSIAAQ
jgi:hypothetical protein